MGHNLAIEILKMQLPSASKFILSALALRANIRCEVATSVREVVAETGFADSTVRHELKSMEGLGLLEVVARKLGRKASITYRVTPSGKMS